MGFNSIGSYTCDCGKTFTSSQSYNGHKSHCKIHYIKKYGNEDAYNNMMASMAERARYGAKIVVTNKKIVSDRKLAKWLASEPKCERCGKIMTEKFGSGRFCSRACASSRTFSEETKQKMSKALSKTIQKLWDTEPEHWTATRSDHKRRVLSYCKVCGKRLASTNTTNLCQKCLRTTPEGKAQMKESGKKGYQTMLENGTHHPWQSRNITSYAEEFWEGVLKNNNIKYTREETVPHGKSNYFLDFYIEVNGYKLDLEIDGKQHAYKDRRESDKQRDNYLKNLGYIVYRITWNNIATQEGKDLMKEKIDQFIAFYKSICK